ncbi:TRADD-N-associated membrane domain-containing protein [Nocardiopsis eucommiae]|uniref:TRADD-N-associated membrane domain-containing protein n=1 Tax=Nocardiopsis eucommiae TaxID=2831970 RepID=UPI003D74331A
MDSENPPEDLPENDLTQRPEGHQLQGPGHTVHNQVSGDIQGNFYQVINHAPAMGGALPQTRSPAGRPDQRRRAQDFLVSVNEQALRHADDSFRMSMVVMGTGALVIAIGVVLSLILALLSTTGAGSVTAVLASSVTGGTILSLGTALALHSHRSRKHLADQAQKVHDELRLEEAIDRVMDITSSLNDPTQGDNLRMMAALRILGLEPTQESVSALIQAQRNRDPG